jgi:hypothetical protein
MSCKERPPRVYSDKKGSYIINGDRKMRITPLNKNTNENTNQNVVNVILKECRTNQKRRRMTKPKPKQPIPMKPLEQQVNDANYKLYHIIQDRKREAQEQLNALIQKVQENSIGIPATDNSLMAIAREMKTSPSELEAKILPSVSQQILNPTPAPAPAVEPAEPVAQVADGFPDEDEKERPPQGEVPAPIPQQQMQLVEAPTDIEVNRAGVPIVDGEMALPQIDELKRVIEEPKYVTLGREQDKLVPYVNQLYANEAKAIATIFKWTIEGKQDKDTGARAKEYLKANDKFRVKFINEILTTKGKDQDDIYNQITRKLVRYVEGNGKGSLMTGLYNDQIDDMLRHEPKYFGCISRDEIHKLQLDDNGKYGFVYNTVPSNKPTIYEGHWRAIYIDLDDGKSIDHYDSFGEPAEEDIQNQIGTLLKPFNLPYYLKWKDNKIVNQRSNSSNCGFFCVNFLQDRFEGKRFVDSTGYSNANKAEKDLKKKFGYLID